MQLKCRTLYELLQVVFKNAWKGQSAGSLNPGAGNEQGEPQQGHFRLESDIQPAFYGGIFYIKG